MKALIDADIIVYQCGFAAESSIYEILDNNGNVIDFFQYKKDADAAIKKLGDGYSLIKDRAVEPLENALHNVKELVNKIQVATKCDDMIFYLTGGENYRDKIAVTKPYKGNRDSTHKPVWYEEIKKYLHKKYNVVVTDGIEADDAMGIAQIEADWFNEQTVICSRDKDMNMIAGWHYNWSYDSPYFVDQDTADEWFYCQLIMGDTTDNIQGVPKAGPKLAERELLQCDTNEERCEAVLNLYLRAYGNDGGKIMKEMGDLLWIQREENKLWEPPIVWS